MHSRLERRQALRNRQSRKNKNIIKYLLIAFAVLMTAIAAYMYFMGGISKSNRSAEFSPGRNMVNILVLGVDVRNGDAGRSDTMMLVTIDQGSGDVSLLSIPRDTRVKIPGRHWDKINHAFGEGGADNSRKAAEGLLGIPIDYYVTIDFAAFVKIVDAVGGVDIDVEKRMYYVDPYDDLVIDLRAGMQHLDGKKAIEYVRYRDEEGDIGRIERQQKFINAMLKQVTSASILPRLTDIIGEVRGVIKTDMSTGNMTNLAKYVKDASQKGLATTKVPGRPLDMGGISYWLPDIILLRDYVARTEHIKADEKYLAAAVKLQAEYDDSLPHGVMNSLPAAKPDKPVVPDKAIEPTKPAEAVRPSQTPATATPKPEKTATKPTQPPASSPKPSTLPPKPPAPPEKPKAETN